MRKTTIVLADDDRLVREALRALLETQPDFSIAGETSDGLQTVLLTQRLKPDVIIVDLMMPRLNGFNITRQVRRRCPQTRVLILTMHAQESYVAEAMKQGASGFILKESSAADLFQAIREAMAGRRYLSPPLSEKHLQVYEEKARYGTTDAHDTLTNREREILQLGAEGYTSAQIGAQLGISPRTVETHRANMMHKLGLRNQTELVRFAIRRGIVPMDGNPKRS